MPEPTFDGDGYPSTSTLEMVENWSPRDFEGLVGYVGQAWRYPEVWEVKGGIVRASTGGWSGNEDLIKALRKNWAFWACCWCESRRGGHYVFKIPKAGRKEAPMTTRTDTERLDFLSETFGHALVHNRYRDQWALIPRSYGSDSQGRPHPDGPDRYQVFWEAEELMWAPDVRSAIDRYMDEEAS